MAAAEIVLGVGASVAIHRALDLTSELRKLGHTVTVLMTEAATRLIAPLQFAAISGRRGHVDPFAAAAHNVYDHLGPGRSADLLIVCPATADLIGRLAMGLGDDSVTTAALAYRGPKILCPAMNWRMWEHPLVQRNLRTLEEIGWQRVGPVRGELACGEEGLGRLAPVEDILAASATALARS